MNAGHEVHIFANRWERDVSPGAILHAVPMLKLNRTTKDLSYSWVSSVLAGRLRPDIVHTQTRVFKYDIATLGGGCYMAYLDAVKIERNTSRERATLAIERAMLSPEGFAKGRRIILNSGKCRDEYIEYYGAPEENLEVVYNGVDSDTFRPRPDIRAAARKEFGLLPNDVAVLFVGPGFQRKGLDTLIQAAKNLPGSVKVLVVGKGKSIEDQRLIRVGQADSMERCYAAADIFALPTKYDPFANSTMEALASGLPVVTTTSNGVSEIMQDGENGLIIGPNDPDALTIRLRTLAEDSNLRERLGSAGRVAVQPYTWQETTRQTMAVYEKFLAEKT